MLFENFETYIKQKNLLSKNDKILLTVSGGIDSMVMMHLFHRKGIECIIAHCNFHLRADESDGDEKFVKIQSEQLDFPFYSVNFDTKEYAESNGISIQMAARELRYSWFNKLAKENSINYISVAHNKDDSLETFFINLSRGTGIAGLTGINPHTENIIRPLLFASRLEITEYANHHSIQFREDSSNASNKYLRNYIRNEILPSLQAATPHFRNALAECMERLQEVNLIYENSIHDIIQNIVTYEKDIISIDISKLIATVSPKTVLFEILKKYQFPSSMIAEILQSLTAISGKQFFSSTHRIVKDREKLLITGLHHTSDSSYYIEELNGEIYTPLSLTFDTIQKTLDFAIERKPTTALLDFNKLSFPLKIRKWHTGDYFIPLGMKGMKKISDFFIDQKLSLAEKENTWLLISESNIIWIIGRRIDDRYKITDATEKIFRLTVKKPTE